MSCQASHLFGAIAVFLFLAASGCATTDQRVDLIYHPTAVARGGSGDLYLVQPQQKREGEVQYILGRITNSEGERKGSVVSDFSPEDLTLDALRQELAAAGYHVVLATSVPPDAEKALTLNSVSIALNEKHSLVTDDAECSAKLKVERWRNGKSVTTLGYEAGYTETAPSGRRTLLPNTLQKTLEILMTNLVPDLVRQLESK